MGGVVGLLGDVVGFCVVLDGLCVLSVLEGSGGAEKQKKTCETWKTYVR